MKPERKPRADFRPARPATIPRPTPWPLAMAFGITFFAAGFLTSPIVLGVGATAFVIALGGWISEIRHEA
ncbi:MAG: hypothetical protein R3B72_44880 [Polyangiaceae bacterium]